MIDIFKTADLSALLIALAGATGSVLGSLYLTNRRINAEDRFRREELTKLLSQNIQVRRLEHYPKLWKLCSECLKPLHELSYKEAEELSEFERIKRLFIEMSEWDSAHSMLLSKESATVVFYARNNISKIMKLISGQIVAEIEYGERNEKLKFSLQQVELALKTDIGIFEIDQFKSRTYFDTYEQLDEEWKRFRAKKGH